MLGDGVDEAEHLLEAKQMLGAPIALQGALDGGVVSLDAAVAKFGQGGAITLAGDDGAQDGLSGVAHDVADDVVQLHVHLGEDLLHALDMATLVGQQHVAVAPEGAQSADLLIGSEGAAQQAKAHELLKPLAIEHIAFAPWQVLDVAGIDQVDLEAARLQDLIDGDPVHAGGLHHHGLDPAALEPVGHAVDGVSEAVEVAHALIIAISGHAGELAGGADINGRAIGIDDGQGL